MVSDIVEGDLVCENYGLNAKVISIFDHVINFQTDQNKGFAITDSSVIPAPYHLILPNDKYKEIKKNALNFHNLRLDEFKIIYNNKKLNIADKKIFIGKIPSTTQVNKSNLIKMTEKVILGTKNLGSLDKSILYFKDYLKNPQAKELNPLQKQFYIKLKILINKNGNLNDLIGLGIGLTPSSDDFIIGYLSVVEAGIAEDVLKIKKSLKKEDFFKMTTRVSALNLKAALKKRFNKSLFILYQNINCNPFQYMKDAQNLINLGSSSGLDILSGVYFCLTV